MGGEGRRDPVPFGDVLEAAKRGEKWAFTQLYRDYDPLLLHFFRHRGCGLDAEDLAMEVWAGVLRPGGGLTTFQGNEKAFAGWLVTIAKRRLVDHQRRWGSRPKEVKNTDHVERIAVNGDGRDPADVVYARVSTDEALALLAEELSPRQLQAVLMHVVGGYKLVEVAHRMGATANSVAVMYHRALKRLAKRLSQETDNHDA